MKVILSRHARRRAQLYGIDEIDVVKTVMDELQKREVLSENMEVMNRTLKNKYGYPLKVVFRQIRGKIVVITAYPLKKERRS